MNSQLKVTITNLTKKQLTVRWLSKGAQCIGPESSLTVDYEPWSCLSTLSKSDMENYLKTGSVELTMHIMSVDGVQHDIKYNPFLTNAGVKVQDAKQTAKVSGNVARIERNATVEDKTHIVVTGNGNAGSLDGFIQSEVKPRGLDNRVEPKSGFVADTTKRAQGVVIDNSNADYLLNKKAKEEADTEESKPARDYRTEFNTLVAQKKWNEALELLIEEFGADRVTFSARTIMTIKDYDEIVSRKLS